MADTFTRQERSWIMGRVLGRGNASTEQILARLLREARIVGWRRHLSLPGNPDFAFPVSRVAVFVDGCFWHSCALHLRLPASNRDYWVRKIARNRRRDQRAARVLRARGWRVVRVWEHALRGDGARKRAVGRIIRAVQAAGPKAGGGKGVGRRVRRGVGAGAQRA